MVAAVGRPCFVQGDWVKDGAIVVDVGINRGDDGKLVGDSTVPLVLAVLGAAVASECLFDATSLFAVDELYGEEMRRLQARSTSSSDSSSPTPPIVGVGRMPLPSVSL